MRDRWIALAASLTCLSCGILAGCDTAASTPLAGATTTTATASLTLPTTQPATTTATVSTACPTSVKAQEPSVIHDVSLGVQGYHLSWSLHGKAVYYHDFYQDGILAVSLTGEQRTVRSAISLGVYPASSIAVASDSSLAFAGLALAEGVKGEQGIWVLESLEADPKVVITSDDGKTFYLDEPSWSPDGSKLAFTHLRVQWLDHGHQDTPYVWIVDRDGTNSRELGPGAHPTWSPDGRNILFAQLPNPPSHVGTQVCIMDTEGANLHRLTDGDYPAWSPDGDWIAYVQQGGLHLLDAKTLRSWKIAEEASPQAAPAWSRDGKMIAYVGERPQTYALRVLHLALPDRE